MKRLNVLVSLLLALAAPLAGQADATLKRAVDAASGLDYPTAIRLARQALDDHLTAADQKVAFRLLGTSYAAMDSGAEAQEAFGQLIVIDPDFDFDAASVSPKITGQYALALAEVLVVRHLSADSVRFVAGREQMNLRYTLTQRARVVVRIEGPDGAVRLDSSLVDPGTVRVAWNGLLADGRPPSGGTYRLVVEARSAGDQFAADLPLRIVAGTVDTLPALTHLPGYDTLPTTVVPPRSFKPLGIASLLTGLVAGSALALENGDLSGGSRREVTLGGGAALALGLVASLSRPAPVPSEPNIRYNTLVHDQLARQNQQIAQANVLRRQQVELDVSPAPRAAP